MRWHARHREHKGISRMASRILCMLVQHFIRFVQMTAEVPGIICGRARSEGQDMLSRIRAHMNIESVGCSIEAVLRRLENEFGVRFASLLKIARRHRATTERRAAETFPSLGAGEKLNERLHQHPTCRRYIQCKRLLVFTREPSDDGSENKCERRQLIAQTRTKSKPNRFCRVARLFRSAIFSRSRSRGHHCEDIDSVYCLADRPNAAEVLREAGARVAAL